MKLSAIFQTLSIASFSTLGYAAIFFERLPSNLTFGQTVKLNWSADHDYTLSMSLYRSSLATSYVADLSSIFYDLPMASGNMSYDWIVPNITVNTGDRFRLELTGKGPMDTAGTTNTTNLFELPVNAMAYEPVSTLSSGYCDDSMPWKYIVAITCGCVGAFLLGVFTTWLAMRLWQKKRTAGAGFEQVDEQGSSSKAAGKEPMREA